MGRLGLTAVVSLAVLLAEHCASITLARYTQQRLDAPRPASTVAVLLSEIIKLLMSIALELGGAHALGLGGTPSSLARLRDDTLGKPRELLRLSVPALLYTVQNNLIYVALANLEVSRPDITFISIY